MHEKIFEKVQQKYFYSIYKCIVAFKLKTFILQMFSKNAPVYVQIMSYFELFKQLAFIEYFRVNL